MLRKKKLKTIRIFNQPLDPAGSNLVYRQGIGVRVSMEDDSKIGFFTFCLQHNKAQKC